MAFMPTPTSCPNFEEHRSDCQSAAEEFREVVSSEPSANDTKALEAHLRMQFHSAEKLIHLLHIEIDDRREINELDIEKIWYLSDTIAGTIQLLNELLKYSENIKQFLERHRELARRHDEKEARSIKWKARCDAVLDFCGLTSFVADIKTKMGKDDESKDKSRFSVRHEYSVKAETTTDSDNNTLNASHNIRADYKKPEDRDLFSSNATHSTSKVNYNSPTNTYKGPIEHETCASLGSGCADDFDLALQTINKNSIQIARHRGIMKKKLEDLTAGKWQVGFRKDLRKRGVMPFSPASTS
ncbi:hypothetical protein IWX49DRAFT_337109 [Phyllosticta citricarpa]|uniref:Uncharacterized protein n=2 Tax=Phyllosticta TaxID=121621 RepID=A0ABR1MC49_9PEZI